MYAPPAGGYPPTHFVGAEDEVDYHLAFAVDGANYQEGDDQLGSSRQSSPGRKSDLSPMPGPADLLLPSGDSDMAWNFQAVPHSGMGGSHSAMGGPHSAMGLLHPHAISPQSPLPPAPGHEGSSNKARSVPVSPAPLRPPSAQLPEWGWPKATPDAGPAPEAPRRMSAAPQVETVAPGATVARTNTVTMRRNKSVLKRGMTMRGAKPQITKVRVVNKADNKSYFSIERTTYQWIYMSTALLGSSLTFFAVEAPDLGVTKLAHHAATLLAVLSLVVMYYAAFYAYRRRRALDRLHKAAAFDDQAGPIIVVAIIVIILMVHQVLSLKNITLDLHKESGPTK